MTDETIVKRTLAGHAAVFWFTGLSGAGKTTIAEGVARRVTEDDRRVLVLDGDDVRTHLHRDLGFTETDIKENNALLVELCRTHRANYDAILVPIISPFASSRQAAREMLSPGFFEVYCYAELDIVVARDTKGLYAKARCGDLEDLIGYSPGAPYEAPQAPNLTISTAEMLPKDAVAEMYRFVAARLP